MFSRLASKLSHLFASTVQSRGLAYYERGSVSITRGSPDSLEAQVFGSQIYEVEVRWEVGDLSFSCSCPYFESDGPCKHLWAAVLAAQDKGYLSRVEVPRMASDFSVADIFSEFAEELGFASRAPAVPKLVPPKPPAWKTRIANVGADKTSHATGEWPAKRQILYVVELACSAAAGHPVLALCTRDRKANGDFGRVATLNLQRGQIASLPLAEDREILSAIAGASQYYSYGSYEDKYGQLPGSSLVRHPLSMSVIPMATRTGRCYLRNSPASGRGCPWRMLLMRTCWCGPLQTPTNGRIALWRFIRHNTRAWCFTRLARAPASEFESRLESGNYRTFPIMSGMPASDEFSNLLDPFALLR